MDAQEKQVKRPGGALIGKPAPSVSEYLPFRGRILTVVRKAYVIPVLVLFFSAFFVPNPLIFFLTLFITAAAYYFLYALCGKKKPWWLILAVAGFSMLFIVTPLWSIVYLVDPLGLDKTDPLLIRIVFNTVGVGFREEFTKAVPVFLLYWWAKRQPSPRRELFGIAEPLDGILLAAASAAGFAFMENVGQYLKLTPAPAGQLAAEYLGTLESAIQRTLDLLPGHIAFTGIFGYFIGLGILRPQNRWKTLAIGYGVAALLHGAWDSLPNGGEFMVGVIGYVVLAAAILKAREISPNRATLMPSLVRGFSKVAAQANVAAVEAPRPVAGPQEVAVRNFAGARQFETPTPVEPAQKKAESYIESVPHPVPAQTAALHWLRIGNQRLPLPIGAKLTEPQVPGLLSAGGTGAVAEVVQNPSNPNVLGLKNLSQLTWNFTPPGGRSESVAPGRNLRLAHGASVDFGSRAGVGVVETFSINQRS